MAARQSALLAVTFLRQLARKCHTVNYLWSSEGAPSAAAEQAQDGEQNDSTDKRGNQ